MQTDFLKLQDTAKPLFPDSLLEPERQDLRGKVLIIGGSSAGFAGVNYAYTKALELGAGEVRVFLPKNLEKLLPKNPDFVFSGDSKALGFTKAVIGDLKGLTAWADGIVLIGDFGKNSETAQTFSHFLTNLKDFSADKKPLLITRDAIDLLLPALPLENSNAKLFLTFAQLQKLLKHVFYPKIVIFSMPLPQLADVIHKFTLTYQCGLATFASDMFIVGLGGEIIATDLRETKYNPLTLWAGEAAVKAILLTLWSPSPKIAGLTESIL